MYLILNSNLFNILIINQNLKNHFFGKDFANLKLENLIMINTSTNINNKKLDENKLTIEVKNSSIPPKILLDNLLIAYKNNSNTEQLANDIIKKYPNHNLAWKILGAIKRQQGLKLDELKANIMAVKLLEQDFEALYNLAITYKTLNKIDYSISFLKRYSF